MRAIWSPAEVSSAYMLTVPDIDETAHRGFFLQTFRILGKITIKAVHIMKQYF